MILFREYEGNYSPSAGQLDGGKQCPDTAQSVQMSSAQLTKIASRVLLTYAAATYTSSPELFISFAMQPMKDCITTRMDHHILELHWLIHGLSL